MSGRVVGPTRSISCRRDAPPLQRLGGWLDVVDVLVLVSELELGMMSTLPDKASFSESVTSLILSKKKKKTLYLLGSLR